MKGPPGSRRSTPLQRGGPRARLEAALGTSMWQRAVADHFGGEEDLIWLLFDEGRRVVEFLLPSAAREDTALVFGWENVAVGVGLARRCHHVVVVEVDLEGLCLARAIGARLGARNLSFVLCGGAPGWPFGRGVFDRVLLPGVLVSAPKLARATDGQPGAAQVVLLCEAGRVLTPTGTVHVESGNRLSWRRLFPLACSLDRRLAHWLAEGGGGQDNGARSVGQDPRGLPTLSSLRAMVRRAGFLRPRLVFASPHHALPAAYVEERTAAPALSSRPQQSSKAFVHRWLSGSWGRRAWTTLKHLSPSFVATARRVPGESPTLLDSLVCHVSTAVFGRPSPAEVLRCYTGLAGDRLAVVVVRFPELGETVVAKLPLTRFAAAFAERNYRALARLRAVGLAAPTPLGRGQVGGQRFFVESFVTGVMGTELPAGPRRRLCGEALTFLAELQRTTRETLAAGQALDWIRPALEQLRHYAAAAAPARVAETDRLVRLVEEAVSDLAIGSLSHGDFWLGNLLASPGGELRAVIDWNASAERCVPGLDWISLLSLTDSGEGSLSATNGSASGGGPMSRLLVLARAGAFETDEARQLLVRAGAPETPATRACVLLEGVRQFAYRLTLFPYPLTRTCLDRDFLPLLELGEWAGESSKEGL